MLHAKTLTSVPKYVRSLMRSGFGPRPGFVPKKTDSNSGVKAPVRKVMLRAMVVWSADVSRERFDVSWRIKYLHNIHFLFEIRFLFVKSNHLT